jgi:hypothetical protein
MNKLPDDVIQETNELLLQLIQECKIDERKPGDVTSIEMSIATGLCKKRCSDILNNKFVSGELTRHKVKSETGQTTYAYYKNKV